MCAAGVWVCSGDPALGVWAQRVAVLHLQPSNLSLFGFRYRTNAVGVQLLRCPAPCFGGGLGGELHAEPCPLGKGEGEKRRTSVVATAVLKLFANKSWSSGLASAAEEAGGVENTLFGKVFLIVSNNSS